MTVETVANVETDGTEDVYDLTVEDTHNFFASESGKRGSERSQLRRTAARRVRGLQPRPHQPL
ncbi:hypothetical protein ACFQJ6_23515, partial [Halorussus caseinilyticus]